MPDNDLHLSEIIGRVYQNDRERLDALNLAKERLAAKLTFETANPMPKGEVAKTILAVECGKRRLSDLRGIAVVWREGQRAKQSRQKRPPDVEACDLIVCNVAAAKEQQQMETWEREGMRQPAWEFVRSKIYTLVAYMGDGPEMIDAFARSVVNGETHPYHALTKELSRLDRTGFRERLEQALWDRYPHTAETCGLPKPLDMLTAADAVARLGEMATYEDFAEPVRKKPRTLRSAVSLAVREGKLFPGEDIIKTNAKGRKAPKVLLKVRSVFTHVAGIAHGVRDQKNLPN